MIINYLFIFSVLLICFGNLRFALFGLAITLFIDPGGLDQWGGSQILTLVKSIAIPIIIIYRFKFGVRLKRGFYYYFYSLFLLFSLILGFRIYNLENYFQMFIYLLSIPLYILMFGGMFKNNLMKPPYILLTFTTGVLSAIYRTYFFSDSAVLFGATENRFTAFMPSQDFAMIYVGLFCLGLSTLNSAIVSRLIILGSFIVILLNGSRISLIGALSAVLIHLLVKNHRLSLAIKSMILPSVILLSYLYVAANLDTLQNSIFSRSVMITAIFSQDGLEAVNTFNVRSEIWDDAKEIIMESSVSEQIAGHGLSNIAYYNPSVQAPHRYFHNEFLRSLFDLGIVGLLSFSLAVAALISKVIRDGLFNQGDKIGVYAIPFLLYALTSENVLAGGGRGSTIFLSICFSIYVVDYLENNPNLKQAKEFVYDN